ncbi:LLM class oxidoreductase [Thalassotalea agariperforans]
MLAQGINERTTFPRLNSGYNAVFQPGKLSIGLVAPIEHYSINSLPNMQESLARVQLAEQLGFKAVWLRDVPFNVPSFGDVGQIFDPFVYLGLLAGQTSNIALGVASLILPLRHPVHVAKAAASVDILSNGRLILGIASGDRPEEYPAMAVNYQERGKLFRESYHYLRQLALKTPEFTNTFGDISRGIDLLPKPTTGRLPLLITGASQQTPDWLAQHGDGWITYPKPHALQAQFIQQIRKNNTETELSKPIMEPLYIDITDDPNSRPQPIHLGFKLGINQLRQYLISRQEIGVNHVALNLRFNQANIESTLKNIAEHVLPSFN